MAPNRLISIVTAIFEEISADSAVLEMFQFGSLGARF